MERGISIRTCKCPRSARLGTLDWDRCTTPRSLMLLLPRRRHVLIAVPPSHRRSDQIGIFSERGECNLCLLCGNKPAPAQNHRANLLEVQVRALHHPAAEDNYI